MQQNFTELCCLRREGSFTRLQNVLPSDSEATPHENLSQRIAAADVAKVLVPSWQSEHLRTKSGATQPRERTKSASNLSITSVIAPSISATESLSGHSQEALSPLPPRKDSTFLRLCDSVTAVAVRRSSTAGRDHSPSLQVPVEDFPVCVLVCVRELGRWSLPSGEVSWSYCCCFVFLPCSCWEHE